jgi:hypothetical protein
MMKVFWLFTFILTKLYNFCKHFISRCCGVQETPFNDFYVAGYGNTTSALTNIRFQMSSGNIDEGTILNVRNRIT